MVLKVQEELLNLVRDNLKEVTLANLLISAKEYIESHYGTYTHPA